MTTKKEARPGVDPGTGEQTGTQEAGDSTQFDELNRETIQIHEAAQRSKRLRAASKLYKAKAAPSSEESKLARIESAQHVAEASLLSGLIQDAARARALIADLPIEARHLCGPHRKALGIALAAPPEEINLHTLRSFLIGQGEDAAAAGLLADDQLINAPSVEQARRSARQIMNCVADRLEYEAGQLLTSGESARARDRIAKADHIRQACSAGPDNAAADLIDAAAWLEMAPPAVDPVIEGLFDSGDKVPVIGSSKTRKTFFALQLALSIASGRGSFLGWRIPRPRRVLFAQMEVKPAHFQRRVHALARALDLSPAELRTGEGRLLVANLRGLKVDLVALAKLAKEHGAGVVILDPVYKLLTGDENAAADVKPFLAMLDRLTTDSGAAVLYVHHNAKGTAGDRETRDRGAGSGTIARDFDAALYLTEHRDGCGLLVLETLLRNYPPQPARVIDWQDGRFIERTDVDPAVKTSKNRDQSGRTKPAPRDQDAMAMVSAGPIRAAAMIATLRAAGWSKNPAHETVARLVHGGALAEYRTKSVPSLLFYGTPDQVEAMRLADQAPAIPGMEEAAKDPKTSRRKGGKNA